MYRDPISHLPDPIRQAEFYEGVTLKRGVAWIFDFIITALLVVPVLVFTAFLGVFFLPLLFFIVGFFYRVFTITHGSATLGMRMMAIEFRDMHGQRLDRQQAFMHTLGYTFTIMTFLLQLVSIGFMFTSERGQGLTDMALGTVALNKRA
ncbi:RDD family protein [Thalassococcus lentus]|uniref:RDD family protein n=1 Tax=Thalassococcus lentus TaxID=1210524 RepID=A0ABT4XQG8_9RHOB|nr:RDD family protein [Thalassococcus lentus]MDA7424199.1 RDD family protein [Thalassococcus lentus]